MPDDKMPTPIPHPSGLPILGNLLSISPGNTWGSFNKLAVNNKNFCVFLVHLRIPVAGITTKPTDTIL